MSQVVPLHAMVGGGVFLTYAIIREILRHHQETLRRPKVIDHLVTCTLMGSFGSAIALSGNLPTLLLNGAVVGSTIGLALWWISLAGVWGSHLK